MGKDLNGKELGEGLSQRKDGYYMGRFYGRDGKRKVKYSTNLSDVKKWIVEAKYEDQHGIGSVDAIKVIPDNVKAKLTFDKIL